MATEHQRTDSDLDIMTAGRDGAGWEAANEQTLDCDESAPGNPEPDSQSLQSEEVDGDADRESHEEGSRGASRIRRGAIPSGEPARPAKPAKPASRKGVNRVGTAANRERSTRPGKKTKRPTRRRARRSDAASPDRSDDTSAFIEGFEDLIELMAGISPRELSDWIALSHWLAEAGIDRQPLEGDPWPLKEATRIFRVWWVHRALARNGGNISATARQLEIARSYLYRIMDTKHPDNQYPDNQYPDNR